MPTREPESRARLSRGQDDPDHFGYTLAATVEGASFKTETAGANQVRLVVTPRIHGIHHSIIPEETCSNWSSGLTLWDRLHGTQRTDVPQEEITIGVPAYRSPKEVTLPEVLVMPFKEQRDSWRLPDDGRPSRAALHAQLGGS